MARVGAGSGSGAAGGRFVYVCVRLHVRALGRWSMHDHMLKFLLWMIQQHLSTDVEVVRSQQLWQGVAADLLRRLLVGLRAWCAHA